MCSLLVCNYVCHIDCEKKLTKRCRGYKSGVTDEEQEEGAEIKMADKDVNFYDDLKNIGCHQFFPKMGRNKYCNVCRQSINLVGKQGLTCTGMYSPSYSTPPPRGTRRDNMLNYFVFSVPLHCAQRVC